MLVTRGPWPGGYSWGIGFRCAAVTTARRDGDDHEEGGEARSHSASPGRRPSARCGYALALQPIGFRDGSSHSERARLSREYERPTKVGEHVSELTCRWEPVEAREDRGDCQCREQKSGGRSDPSQHALRHWRTDCRTRGSCLHHQPGRDRRAPPDGYGAASEPNHGLTDHPTVRKAHSLRAACRVSPS